MYNDTGANHIIRLNADGSPDSGFPVGSGFNYRVREIMPAGDGSGNIYVSGWFTTYNGIQVNQIVRLKVDGSVDSGFVSGSGFDAGISALALAEDGTGDIYVSGGFTSYNGTGANQIIRLNADGSMDSGFVSRSHPNAGIRALVPAGDGSGDIYVGGSDFVVRLNADGSLDFGFAFVFDGMLARDGTGRIYAQRSIPSSNGPSMRQIIRLNADGSRDPSFETGSGFGNVVLTLIPAGDGSGDIYVGGDFTTYNGVEANNIIRLNTDGSVDTDFVIGSGFNHNVSQLQGSRVGRKESQVGPILSTVHALMLAPDESGDIYAGGDFTTYNGTPARGMIRLNSDGSVDPNFVIGNGFNDVVYTLSPVGDGTPDIYVGGDFTSYGNTTVGYIARLGPDGTSY